uniref:Uncharacterized protein n=1 Tax=Timema poppense TaxID=170557 RepID=A0A7R9D6A9_TIMPO|nr:unnamed protein product [Timema poppensis]
MTKLREKTNLSRRVLKVRTSLRNRTSSSDRSKYFTMKRYQCFAYRIVMGSALISLLNGAVHISQVYSLCLAIPHLGVFILLQSKASMIVNAGRKQTNTRSGCIKDKSITPEYYLGEAVRGRELLGLPVRDRETVLEHCSDVEMDTCR